MKLNSTLISTYLREIIYGGSDGITTTFAVIAGFNGAGLENSNIAISAVILFGFASLFADGTSMGLGNFLSIRSEMDVFDKFKNQTLMQLKKDDNSFLSKTREILLSKNFKQEDLEDQLHLFRKNKEYWAKFWTIEVLKIDDPENDNPIFTGFATFLAFVGFGFLTLLPYLFLDGNANNFIYSIVITVVSLTSLAILRWKESKISLHKALLETVGVGSVAAVVAYIVGIVVK